MSARKPIVAGNWKMNTTIAEGLALVDNALVPIVCVGESLEQKERGEAESVVTRQVRAALDGVEHLSAVVIAYEPMWAIGTGRASTPEDANAAIGLIRRTVEEIGGTAV